jgi:diguanylate cyclase (GGDEF)-like protein
MDALGRIGGDEFAVVLPGVGEADTRRIVARLHAALLIETRASVGHSSFPADGTTADELYRRADEALYAAKGSRAAPATTSPLPG